MATNAKGDLIAALRSRLSDDRASVPAFGLQVTGNCRSATLEVANGFLVVTVEGGETVSSIHWNLSSPSYSTIGRLLAAFQKQPGYTVTPDTAVSLDYPSSEIRVDGFPDLANKKVHTIKLRLFSDEEMSRFLEDAVVVHNPNYTVQGVPKVEQAYILAKAQAIAYRALAADTVRRKTLDTDALTLLDLARDLENQYEKDRERMERIIPLPKADESRVGSGDAIQGTLFRSSLRRGGKVSARSALPPSPPTLYPPADDDVEDVFVRLRWSASRDTSFSRYELWRDGVPGVERSVAGRGFATGLPQTVSWSKASTSKIVSDGGGTGFSSTFDGFTFGVRAEFPSGNHVHNTSFVDGLNLVDPLEPETTYYYRLYLANTNGEVLPSEVIRVTTKRRRALFGRTGKSLAWDAVLPLMGPLAGGTTVTIKGTNFEQGVRVYINNKECSIVSLTSTEIVITTPGQTNASFINLPLDIVLVSPSGLKDIAIKTWKYT